MKNYFQYTLLTMFTSRINSVICGVLASATSRMWMFIKIIQMLTNYTATQSSLKYFKEYIEIKFLTKQWPQRFQRSDLWVIHECPVLPQHHFLNNSSLKLLFGPQVWWVTYLCQSCQVLWWILFLSHFSDLCARTIPSNPLPRTTRPK